LAILLSIRLVKYKLAFSLFLAKLTGEFHKNMLTAPICVDMYEDDPES
jgi:hypothetical protein